MRQAIEERFILDVLTNYTTYATYYRLLKAAENLAGFGQLPDEKAAWLAQSVKTARGRLNAYSGPW
jgi:hypothetical protein